MTGETLATVLIASSYGSSTIVSDGPTASSPAGPLLPEFNEPIRNVTVPMGREAVLSCVISNLGEYKVTIVLPLAIRLTKHSREGDSSKKGEKEDRKSC